MMRRVLAVAAAAILTALAMPHLALAADCRFSCPRPGVSTGEGALTASFFENRGGSGYASNTPPEPPPYQWRLRTPCAVSDPVIGACDPNVTVCEQPPDRVVRYYIVQSQRLARADGAPIDGQAPPLGTPAGTGYGQWANVFAGCVDVTDLNPPPSAGEVFRYFQTLPLPPLTTRQQPPGNGLVGLPVIFYTDSPTTQTFTLDIRGFTVVIAATATGYTWHTGDGTELTSTDPGRPYPDHTVTHDYRAGTYTASLTTTWSATFTVDGGAPADVPGTTTTDGPPVTFTVLQARPVLTNPYD
jgi:hypothetical protein